MTTMTDNITLFYIGPFGFANVHAFLTSALQNTTDPHNSPYFQSAEAGYTSITNNVCHIITNSSSSWGSWAVYEHQDIWNRIV